MTHIIRMAMLGGTLLITSCAVTNSNNSNSEDSGQATTSNPLKGTAWQLVQIMSMDDRVFEPRERSNYTINFVSDDRIVIQADCNNAQGTWSFREPSGLEFGVLAATQALCPPESLHDRLMSDLNYVRSFVFEDGNLFLATMADSAILEFEPISP